ncbi:MAG TPA: argininosuccinate lyase [Spirochaetes bacterium]|nr:argininosuccinate lyase [Spirochaetota bacterium]
MPIRDGRFDASINSAFSRINASIAFDKKLYREDIKGSAAYAGALFRKGILSGIEKQEILDGLESIVKEIEEGRFPFKTEDEDIHMNIERRLFEKIGEAAHKLHTGRSRNEQIVLDERLYLMDTVEALDRKITTLLKSIFTRAQKFINVIIPSYTHLRQAQLVSLSHIFLAYYHSFRRDKERLDDYKKRLKVLPLGSGAVAGSTLGIDRDFLMKELSFETLSHNSIDAVSTRDYIIEFEFICVSLLITLSRISEDLIIFSADETGYFLIPDDLTTTSSMMPHKKNPDSLELIRGKSARVIGNLVSIITLMKGLPYTYNRDLQEDKEGLFDTVETTFAVVDVMVEVVKGLAVNENKIKEALVKSKGFLFATDLADYLVLKGAAFRNAHRIVGSIVKYALDRDKSLQDLTLEEYRTFSKDFARDVYEVFDSLKSVNNHDTIGGTALNRVSDELKRIKKELKDFG